MAAGFATSVEDAFRRLIGRGLPGYVPRDGLGPIEAIRAIRAAGGLPVLAHFREAPDAPRLLRELDRRGARRARGLLPDVRPADHGRGGRGRRRRSACSPTGGTDYHGDTGTYAEAHAQLWVPPEVGDGLLARLEPARRQPPADVGSASSLTNVGRSSIGRPAASPGPEVEAPRRRREKAIAA